MDGCRSIQAVKSTDRVGGADTYNDSSGDSYTVDDGVEYR